jgi:hypothetical protein
MVMFEGIVRQRKAVGKLNGAVWEVGFETGVVDASEEHHNKAQLQHTFFSTAPSAFLTAALTYKEDQ